MDGMVSDRQELQLEELLTSLPACRRCRANKRRCDTELPSCRNCAKAGIDCVFYDHVLEEDLPRSYIASLVEALEQAQSPAGSRMQVHDFTNNESPSEPCAASAFGMAAAPDARDFIDQSISSQRLNITSSKLPTRYVGKLSCLTQCLSIRGGEEIADPIPIRQPLAFEELQGDLIVRPRMHQFLLQTYLTEIHPLYPFLDRSFRFLSPQSPLIQDLSPSESFILQMVYSVACHCCPGIVNRLVALSDACHARAVQCFDSATADLSVVTLQAITLMALRSLFDPQKGNFGQLITFAGRLAIDIGGQDMPARGENMRDIQTSIYCMENQFATVLDRPPFLTEPTRTIDLDIGQPSEFLCSLYRIQAKFRRGSQSEARALVQTLDIEALERQISISHLFSPNLLSTVYETQMLLDPKIEIAKRLLGVYSHPGSIHTFLTPQWTYRAALIVLEKRQFGNSPDLSAVEAYGTALVILDRAAQRWRGAAALSESLRLYVKTMEK